MSKSMFSSNRQSKYGAKRHAKNSRVTKVNVEAESLLSPNPYGVPPERHELTNVTGLYGDASRKKEKTSPFTINFDTGDFVSTNRPTPGLFERLQTLEGPLNAFTHGGPYHPILEETFREYSTITAEGRAEILRLAQLQALRTDLRHDFSTRREMDTLLRPTKFRGGMLIWDSVKQRLNTNSHSFPGSWDAMSVMTPVATDSEDQAWERASWKRYLISQASKPRHVNYLRHMLTLMPPQLYYLKDGKRWDQHSPAYITLLQFVNSLTIVSSSGEYSFPFLDDVATHETKWLSSCQAHAPFIFASLIALCQQEIIEAISLEASEVLLQHWKSTFQTNFIGDLRASKDITEGWNDLIIAKLSKLTSSIDVFNHTSSRISVVNRPVRVHDVPEPPAPSPIASWFSRQLNNMRTSNDALELMRLIRFFGYSTLNMIPGTVGMFPTKSANATLECLPPQPLVIKRLANGAPLQVASNGSLLSRLYEFNPFEGSPIYSSTPVDFTELFLNNLTTKGSGAKITEDQVPLKLKPIYRLLPRKSLGIRVVVAGLSMDLMDRDKMLLGSTLSVTSAQRNQIKRDVRGVQPSSNESMAWSGPIGELFSVLSLNEEGFSSGKNKGLLSGDFAQQFSMSGEVLYSSMDVSSMDNSVNASGTTLVTNLLGNMLKELYGTSDQLWAKSNDLYAVQTWDNEKGYNMTFEELSPAQVVYLTGVQLSQQGSVVFEDPVLGKAVLLPSRAFPTGRRDTSTHHSTLLLTVIKGVKQIILDSTVDELNKFRNDHLNVSPSIWKGVDVLTSKSNMELKTTVAGDDAFIGVLSVYNPLMRFFYAMVSQILFLFGFKTTGMTSFECWEYLQTHIAFGALIGAPERLSFVTVERAPSDPSDVPLNLSSLMTLCSDMSHRCKNPSNLMVLMKSYLVTSRTMKMGTVDEKILSEINKKLGYHAMTRTGSGRAIFMYPLPIGWAPSGAGFPYIPSLIERPEGLMSIETPNYMTIRAGQFAEWLVRMNFRDLRLYKSSKNGSFPSNYSMMNQSDLRTHLFTTTQILTTFNRSKLKQMASKTSATDEIKSAVSKIAIKLVSHSRDYKRDSFMAYMRDLKMLNDSRTQNGQSELKVNNKFIGYLKKMQDVKTSVFSALDAASDDYVLDAIMLANLLKVHPSVTYAPMAMVFERALDVLVCKTSSPIIPNLEGCSFMNMTPACNCSLARFNTSLFGYLTSSDCQEYESTAGGAVLNADMLSEAARFYREGQLELFIRILSTSPSEERLLRRIIQDRTSRLYRSTIFRRKDLITAPTTNFVYMNTMFIGAYTSTAQLSLMKDIFVSFSNSFSRYQLFSLQFTSRSY